MKGLWIGSVLAILVGVLVGGVGVVGMTTTSDLAEVGREATIFETSGGKRPYGRFRTASGEVLSCGGYHDVGEVILYDPARPTRCRAQADVGGATGNEMMFLTFGGVLILVGALGFLFEVMMTRDDTLDLVKQGKLPIPPPPGREG